MLVSQQSDRQVLLAKQAHRAKLHENRDLRYKIHVTAGSKVIVIGDPPPPPPPPELFWNLADPGSGLIRKGELWLTS